MNDTHRERMEEILEKFIHEMTERYDYGWEKEELRYTIHACLFKMSDTQFNSLCEKIVDTVFDTF